MSENLDEMINARKKLAAQAMQTRLELAVQKQHEKLTRWRAVKKNEEKKFKKRDKYEELACGHGHGASARLALRSIGLLRRTCLR